jgi:uncharacterized membrane protein
VVFGRDVPHRRADDLEGAALKAAAIVSRSGVLASCLLLVGGLLFRSTAIVQAGLGILVATPLLVLCCVTADFLRKHERPFALLSIGVLLLLFVSLLLALP